MANQKSTPTGAPTDDPETPIVPDANVIDQSANADNAQPDEAIKDKPTSADAVSPAPPRAHDGIVGMLAAAWADVRNLVSSLEGFVEDKELSEVLTLARKHNGS